MIYLSEVCEFKVFISHRMHFVHFVNVVIMEIDEGYP